ncbi:DUF1642 domain-containing protein [Paenibacillus sp. N4]|uniref:DUF1642 domain-containing protein n=1 Tax=Paenibacillus vietnamensis TaxID=2590547 RepID=UPI001CD1130A|nr:DUF1642 domain-containing protein [Paenibacillus vietnamensis]MCA0754867.1 DUF1642 domain-containing protein [Paenibacillus vietnamensis]
MKKLLKIQLESIKNYQNRAGYVNGGIIESLLNHIDALDFELKETKKDEQEIVAEYGQAMGVIDRLQDNIVQLQRELTEAREAKKVKLPREVADAIEYFRGCKFGNDSFARLMFRGHEKDDNDHTITLKRYSHGNGEDLLSALINGYTVENPPTAEERMVNTITQLLTDQGIECPMPITEFAELLTLAAREAVAEDQQAELK